MYPITQKERLKISPRCFFLLFGEVFFANHQRNSELHRHSLGTHSIADFNGLIAPLLARLKLCIFVLIGALSCSLHLHTIWLFITMCVYI